MNYKKYVPSEKVGEGEILVEGYGERPLKIVKENYDGKHELIMVERSRDSFMVVKLSAEEPPKTVEKIDLMPHQCQTSKDLEKHIKQCQEILTIIQAKELAEKQKLEE